MLECAPGPLDRRYRAAHGSEFTQGRLLIEAHTADHHEEIAFLGCQSASESRFAGELGFEVSDLHCEITCLRFEVCMLLGQRLVGDASAVGPSASALPDGLGGR